VFLLQISEITVGGSVEIEVIMANKTINFKSKVAFIKNNTIFIESIKFNDRTVGFSDKFKLNFLYKKDEKLYKWEYASVKLIKYNGGIYHKVNIIGEGMPYNRRDYFRLYIGEEMPIFINSANGATALTVLVKDISESGVDFISKEDIDVNRTIRLKLKNNNTIINLNGIIVRREYNANLQSFVYGCKFYEKSNDLGKYIAKRQSEMIRKRLSSPASNVRTFSRSSNAGKYSR